MADAPLRLSREALTQASALGDYAASKKGRPQGPPFFATMGLI
jgi:hypothetical protein